MAASVSAFFAPFEVVYRCLWLTVVLFLLFAAAFDVVAVWFYMFWCGCSSCWRCMHASEQPLTTQKQDFVSLFFIFGCLIVSLVRLNFFIFYFIIIL